MHVGVWEGAAGWIRVAGVGHRAFDVAQRAFRMAGVGKGVTWCVAGYRFAWQAQGIVRGSSNRWIAWSCARNRLRARASTIESYY